MDFKRQLVEVKQHIPYLMKEVYRILDKTDWLYEADECLEDRTYSPIRNIPVIVNNITFYDLKLQIMGQLNSNPNPTLCELLWEVDTYVKELRVIQVKRFKEEFMKMDPDLRPNLLCNDCGYFGVSEEMVDNHICKKSVTCKNCNKDCRTYERLQAHTDKQMCMKKHTCEKCNYKTNSDNSWKIHLRSKEHTGFQKGNYYCEPCKFSANYLSKFQDHCATTKHKTRNPTD